MVEMIGGKRILNYVIEESGTAQARTISLYGANLLSELIGVHLIVKSNFVGAPNTTMKINELDIKAMKVIKGGIKSNLESEWIYPGQLYVLTFDGTDFLVSPIGNTEADEPVKLFTEITSDILALTSASTESEITTAFGGADSVQEFITAVRDNNSQVVIRNDTDVGYITVLEQKSVVADTDVSDSISFIVNGATITMSFVGTITTSTYTAVVITSQSGANLDAILAKTESINGITP